jgi:uridine phosphorylase
MVKRKIIPVSELILHEDNSVYHLKIKPENLADTVILVGDPQRVETVSDYFDEIEFKGENREIKTHTGFLNKKRLTVMSTGMGVDNIDIVLNELDALINIDLDNRTIKDQHRALTLIRVGTSGAIQPDIPPNAFILSEFGLGLDGVLKYYQNADDIIDKNLTRSFIAQAHWPADLPQPYAVQSSESLFRLFKKHFICGITATAPGFYAPQGRELRLPLAYPDINKKMQKFSCGDKRIVNFEMETSALYGLSKLLGHDALTMCVAIANRNKHNFSQDYKKAMKKLIELLFEVITNE